MPHYMQKLALGVVLAPLVFLLLTHRLRINRTSKVVAQDISHSVARDGTDQRLQPCTQERTNFVYIKMHKSASETLSAVFRRFGFLRNLSFVLPARNNNNLGWPWPLVPGMYRPSKASGYNILCEHSVHSEEVYPALMPPDTVFTTSLREPFARLKSAFSYFEFPRVVGIKAKDAVSEFLKSPQKWDSAYTSRKNASKRRGSCVPSLVSVTRNAQAFDMGFPMGFPTDNPKYEDRTHNSTFVASWLVSIKKRFKFVIIAEYLDESLILWRRLMCWKMQDIVYYSRNVGSKSWRAPGIEPHLVVRYREWSGIDFQLYDHYNRTLWHSISLEEPSFWNEVETFKRIMRKVTHFCSSTPGEGRMVVVEASEWNSAFSYTEADCQLLKKRLMPELRRQYDDTRKWVPWIKPTGPVC